MEDTKASIAADINGELAQAKGVFVPATDRCSMCHAAPPTIAVVDKRKKIKKGTVKISFICSTCVTNSRELRGKRVGPRSYIAFKVAEIANKIK